MEYKDTYKSYMEYANKCKEYLKNTMFTKEDAWCINYTHDNDINRVVTEHRLKMIDIKVDHTMRMIEQIMSVNEKMNFRFNFSEIMKVAILYHDIGRLRQATWSNTYSDSTYKKFNMPYADHGEDGYNIFINNDFNVDSKYIPVVGQSIYHHVNLANEDRLQYKYNGDLSKLDIDKILTGGFDLNEGEWQAASIITQLVADIDKADILYQHLLDSFEMIRNYVCDRSFDSLDNVAKNWGISKTEIIEFNNIDEQNYIPKEIKIPIKNVELSKLELPDYFKEMFYNNSWLPLSELKKDKNWNFISVLWWRLSVFLSDISFYSTLEAINDSEIISKIYERIPDNLKPLFTEAINYSLDVLVNKKLVDNKGEIYLK